jgi:hypothetical protein
VLCLELNALRSDEQSSGSAEKTTRDELITVNYCAVNRSR